MLGKMVIENTKSGKGEMNTEGKTLWGTSIHGAAGETGKKVGERR